MECIKYTIETDMNKVSHIVPNIVTDSDSIFESEIYKNMVKNRDLYSTILMIKRGYIPAKLYRYRRWGEFSTSELNGHVYFTQYDKLDDDHEFPLDRYTINTIIEHKGYREWLNRKRLRHDSLAFMSYLTDYSDEIIKRFQESLVLACFSECYDSAGMWGKYAENSSGYCIEYDTLLMLSQMGKKSYFMKDTAEGEMMLTAGEALLMSLYPVIYSDQPYFPVVLSEYLKIAHLKNAESIRLLNETVPACLSKNAKDWDFQREWRMIHSKYSFYHDNPFFQIQNGCIDFSPCITRIMIGSRCSNEKKEIIVDKGKEKGWDVVKLHRDTETFGYVEETIYSAS